MEPKLLTREINFAKAYPDLKDQEIVTLLEEAVVLKSSKWERRIAKREAAEKK